MNQTQTIATKANHEVVENEFGVIDLLIVLAKHKKLIIGLPLLVATAAAAISFAVPDIYRASTKLLPPQQAQSGAAAALLSQLGGAAGAVAGAAGIKNPNDVYVGMLKSRTIAEKLIEKYELTKVYEKSSLEKTRIKLEDNTFIATGKDGFISIEVEDEDRQRAAKLANSYVDELLRLTKVLAVTEAAQRRVFFERQLEMSKNNLASAEMTLKGTLDTHGVISVDADSRAIVETMGRLRAHVAAKEIEIGAMSAFVTTNNQAYKRAQEELTSLRSELSKLQNGRPATESSLRQGGSKQAGLENIKILRDVKYYQMLYELLAKQYEMARLDEAKDTSVIQVLDSAVAPERKFKPRRAIIVLASAVLGLLAAIAWAFFSDAKQRSMLIPERAARWATLKSYIRFR